MNKKISMLLIGSLVLGSTSCMDDSDEPNTDNYIITSPVSIGETNSTIYDVKTKFMSKMSTTNKFVLVEDDIIFEGVVCANDEGGNLYQSIYLRDVKYPDKVMTDVEADQLITLGIKNTYLAPYFKLGQRVKVNLNGLYIGNYSKVPKIGQPYYTSSGNLRLGPMLLDYCKTNIELVGEPDPDAVELVPIDLTTEEGIKWLKSKSNQTVYNTPKFVKVRGTIKQYSTPIEKGDLSGDYESTPKIFGPKALYDLGYGVDRTLQYGTNKSDTITLRTSTQNDCSFLKLPSDERSYVGVLSYYSGWQFNIRMVTDVERYEELQ